MAEIQRKLAAIVAMDVVGYSRLMGVAEEQTIAALRAHRSKVIEPQLALHNGRIANTAGDSFLIEFPSAVDALRCTIKIQKKIAERNADIPANRRLIFRVGINVGDVVPQGEDLLGDGVKFAARLEALEALAAPGGICVSRSARDQVRDRLDVKFEDLGNIEVKNIARPVRAFAVSNLGEAVPAPTATRTNKIKWAVWAAFAVVLIVTGGLWALNYRTGTAPAPASLTDAQSPGPSIAVLPFSNLSDGKAQAYFAAGMTEDITTDLSKVPGLYVTSRSATQRFRNPDRDLRKIAMGLGVAHLLEGSVRRAGETIRITAKLIDAVTGDQVWAERFDRNASDLFAIQDEIAKHVVQQLSASLKGRALQRRARSYVPDIDAYDLYIQGRAKRIPPSPENLSTALKLFEQAIFLDPKFSGGYAGASFVHSLYAFSPGSPQSPQAHLDAALELGKKAVALDDTFGPAHGSLAEAFFRHRRFDEAIAVVKRAIELAPSDSLMQARYARFLGYNGAAADGIEQAKKALRMSPDSLPPLFFLGINYRADGQFANAIEALEEHRKRLGGRLIIAPGLHLAAAYGQAGRLDEAAKIANALGQMAPNLNLEFAARTNPYRGLADLENFLEGLRKAGVADT